MSELSSILGHELPLGWRSATVNDIKSKDKHSCVAGPFGSSISSRFFVPEGIPVIRGANLSEDLTRFIDDGFVFVSEERAKTYAAQTVRANDIIFTCWGSIGQVGIIPQRSKFSEYVISNKQLKLRVDCDIIRPLFAYYYFASPGSITYIKNHAVGAAVPGINLGILKALPIVVPPLPVQDKIVSVLAAYDHLVENNTRRVAILEKIARRIFEEWFVHFHAPGCEALPLSDSTMGPVPYGWKIEQLRDLARVNPEQISPKTGPSTINYIDLIHPLIF